MSLINITDLTTEDLEGTGIFDILMNATKIHIKEEFDANRVTGSDYAKMYSAAITQVLQQSIQFLLNKEINGNQGDLIAAQVTKLAKDEALVDEQILNMAQQVELTQAQVSIAYAQIQDSVLIKNVDTAVLGILGKQATGMAAQTDLTGVQELVAQAQITNPTAGMLKAQLDMLTAQKNNAVSENANIGKTGSKTDAETNLLSQKKVTEEAQTVNTTVGGSAIQVGAVAGLIGKQTTLYTAQADGFARDAEQKFAKIATDMWSVKSTVLGTGTYPDGGVWTEVDIRQILEKAKEGIGLTN
jgi:hypothetical protein